MKCEHNTIICYRILGTLPAPWEDFYSLSKRHPGISLYTKGYGQEIGAFDPAWHDASVLQSEVTACGARHAIADLLGVDAYRIVILQSDICEAC